MSVTARQADPKPAGTGLRLAEHSILDIIYMQRQAALLAALRVPRTSPQLAAIVGGNKKHIIRKLRALEAAGMVVAVRQQRSRGRAITWGLTK